MSELDRVYPEAYNKLLKLFRIQENREAQDLLQQLGQIYDVTEKYWDLYIKHIEEKRTPIRILMFAESAPWSEPGEDFSYFYYNAAQGGWCGRILSGLNAYYRPDVDGRDVFFSELASKGFLLVDTIPFAMVFSNINKQKMKDYLYYLRAVQKRSGIRNNMGYQSLIDASKSYIEGKLNDPRITWSNQVIALTGLRNNAAALDKVYPNGLTLANGQTLRFSDNKSVRDITDGAGFPNPKKLLLQSHNGKRVLNYERIPSGNRTCFTIPLPRTGLV